MKTIKKVLVLASLGLLIGGLNSNVSANAGLHEGAYDENNLQAVNVLRGATLGESDEVQVSKTFVQSGVTTYEGREVGVMRFATAVKGAIDSISYSRGSVEGAADVDPSEVTTVYSSITANGTAYYYDGTGLSEDAANRGKYYWAVYTIRFVSGDTFKYTNMTVSLEINGRVESSRTASLAEAIYGEHTHNYVNTSVDSTNHRGVCDACGTLGDVENHVFNQSVESNEYLKSAADCEHAATYYKSCLCGAKGEELFSVGEALGHEETNCGDLYEYNCSKCDDVRYRLDVRDYRLVSTRAANKEGLGCTWGSTVTSDLSFVATKAEKANIYIQLSRDTKEINVTDFYNIELNGVKLTSGAKIPAYSSRAWTTYDTILLGEYDVEEGYNSLVVSYTPQRTDNSLPNYNLAYNLLSVSFRGKGAYDFAKCGMCEGIRGCEETSCEHNHCSCYEFDAYDSRTLCDVAKNDSELCIGGSAAGTKITYYIHSDKAITASLYTNVSAIATKWEVAYSKTWIVTVNGAEVTTSTIHHKENDTAYVGASDINRYFNYEFEYVNDVTLQAGINKIVFTATGSEKLNFRDLGIKADGANLEFATYCPVCEKCTLDDCALNDGCTCGADTFTFMGVDEHVEVSGCFRKVRGAIGQNGYANEGSHITFTINASEATNAELVVLLSSNTAAQNVNDVYGLTVNGNEVTTTAQTVVGNRWAHYTAVSFGEFALNANANTFNITYRGTEANDAYNFLTFAIIADAGSISW